MTPASIRAIVAFFKFFIVFNLDGKTFYLQQQAQMQFAATQ
jgi:hypothetical protein